MRIRIVTPRLPGNRVTAARWEARLTELGHEVTVGTALGSGDEDLLVALHARRSHRAAVAWRRRHGARPLVVGLTGTDLYRDLPGSAPARESLRLADRLVLLQPEGRRALPAAVRHKARVIHQSVARPRPRRRPVRAHVRACVLAWIRPVKDPFLAARAVRHLPPSSRLEVVHAGGALTAAAGARARAESASNPRYRWVGERSGRGAARLLASSHALVVSSRLEGGANVVSEAIALGVPVLSTAIPGSTGVLGAGWPGLFPVGDADALRDLLLRLESDRAWRRDLTRRLLALRPLVEPARERAAWRDLLAGLVPSGRRGARPLVARSGLCHNRPS